MVGSKKASYPLETQNMVTRKFGENPKLTGEIKMYLGKSTKEKLAQQKQITREANQRLKEAQQLKRTLNEKIAEQQQQENQAIKEKEAELEQINQRIANMKEVQ